MNIPDRQKRTRLIQCIIASSCLFPLFFYAFFFMKPPFAIFLVVAQNLGGIIAFPAFFFLISKRLSPCSLLAWLLLSVSPLMVFLSFLFFRQMEYFILPFWGIQFIYPAIHIIYETKRTKGYFRYGLACIYVFFITIGCFILLFRKECYFPVFPLAALAGVLLELSFLKSPFQKSDKQL